MLCLEFYVLALSPPKVSNVIVLRNNYLILPWIYTYEASRGWCYCLTSQARQNGSKAQPKPICVFTKRGKLTQYLFSGLLNQTSHFSFGLIYQTDASCYFQKLGFSISFNGELHDFVLDTKCFEHLSTFLSRTVSSRLPHSFDYVI